jgi:hypothetical protein
VFCKAARFCASSFEQWVSPPNNRPQRNEIQDTRPTTHYFPGWVYRRIQASLQRYRSCLSEHAIATLVGKRSTLQNRWTSRNLILQRHNARGPVHYIIDAYSKRRKLAAGWLAGTFEKLTLVSWFYEWGHRFFTHVGCKEMTQ